MFFSYYLPSIIEYLTVNIGTDFIDYSVKNGLKFGVLWKIL